MKVAILFLILCSYASPLFSAKIHLRAPQQASHPQGLTKEVYILKQALEERGHRVSVNDSPDFHDIAIFIEKYDPQGWGQARYHLFIPNPEYCPLSLNTLRQFDLILVKTREAEKIFSKLGLNTFFLGFTGIDKRMAAEKKFGEVLHLKGASPLKGTNAVMKAWKKPKKMPHLFLVDWSGIPYKKLPPHLTLYNYYLEEENLSILQNQCGIHLCPSETEGFGHSLHEALSVGAVVVTTDAPPMNEVITDSSCLVPVSSSSPKNYATLFQVDPKGLRQKMVWLSHLPEPVLLSMGEANRKKFEWMRKDFYANLDYLLSHIEPLCFKN